MSYKKPNIKGPRVKMKSTRVMNEVMLRVFKNKHPEYKNLTLADFNTVVKKFNENIIEEVINSRYGVTLPERIGRLVVVAFPKAKKKIIKTLLKDMELSITSCGHLQQQEHLKRKFR